MLKTALSFLFFLNCAFLAQAGEFNPDDSLKNNAADTSYHQMPKRAAILSAIVPGAGQIYNEIGYRKIPHKKHRAWWKVPLVYGGLGAFGYYFYHNNQFASLTRQEIEKRRELNIEGEGYYDARFANYSTENQLINGFELDENTTLIGYDKYASRRDIFAFAFVAFWGLNVIEAYVDAHFVTFDASDDLSLSWSPAIIGYQNPGISLRLNFN